MNIAQKLDRLAELQAALEVNRLNKEAAIAKVLTPEIQKALADIDAEFSCLTFIDQAARLQEEIKADVLNNGGTVKGAALMAVYNKPRVTWDNKGLDGFMVAHPEIKAFRKEGEASVSIRAVKG